MDDFQKALKNVFPFADKPRYTYSSSLQNGCSVEMWFETTESRLFQWCQILGMRSPIDFVRNGPGQSDNKVLKALGFDFPTIENWGFSDIEFTIETGGRVTLRIRAQFFDTKVFIENMTKIGHVVANLYMDAEIGELILKEENNG